MLSTPRFPDARPKIQADLLSLEQKLRATKASDEEIALRKADYFLNYPVKHKTDNNIHHLWSDALQTLFQVQQPSADFKKKREAFVADLFKSEDSFGLTSLSRKEVTSPPVPN